MITWVVPSKGKYKITAVGGQGGCTSNGSNGGQRGGAAAKISGTFILNSTDKLIISPGIGGGNGYYDPHGNEAGGGGASMVVVHTGKSDPFPSKPLVVAGGGGACPSWSYGGSSGRNYISQSMAYGHSGTSTSRYYNAYIGSCNFAGISNGNGGYSRGSNQGGAGAGYLGNGANGGSHCRACHGGKALSGSSRGQGGQGNGCYSSTTYNMGGFGGGGGGCLGGPGAGGGWSGGHTCGQWSSYSGFGQGGSSYNAGSDQSNQKGAGRVGLPANYGYIAGSHGWVEIELVSSA